MCWLLIIYWVSSSSHGALNWFRQIRSIHMKWWENIACGGSLFLFSVQHPQLLFLATHTGFSCWIGHATLHVFWHSAEKNVKESNSTVISAKWPCRASQSHVTQTWPIRASHSCGYRTGSEMSKMSLKACQKCALWTEPLQKLQMTLISPKCILSADYTRRQQAVGCSESLASWKAPVSIENTLGLLMMELGLLV